MNGFFVFGILLDSDILNTIMYFISYVTCCYSCKKRKIKRDSERVKSVYVSEEREKEQKNWQLLDNGNEVKSFISICAHML